MTNLMNLANVDMEEVSRDEICAIMECESRNLNSVLKLAFESSEDLETLKKIAIVHSGYDYQFSLEDVLIERMGDDAYDEFADENDL
jgi:hypothetical protein